MSNDLIKRFLSFDNEIYEYLVPFVINRINDNVITEELIINEIKTYVNFLFPRQFFGDNEILYKIMFKYVRENKIISKILLGINKKQKNIMPSVIKLRKKIFNTYLDSNINYNMPVDKFDNIIGYKSKTKRRVLNKTNYGKYLPPSVEKTSSTRRFPLKENKKLYSLRSVAPKDVFLIDLMFDGDNTYLIMININTRKLRVRQTNIKIEELKNKAKSAQAIKLALESIIKQIREEGKNIRLIKGDKEKAFVSKTIIEFLFNEGIDFKTVVRENINQKTISKHSSLAIIDRVIRTIRDLAFNMNLETIEPDDMNNIVWQYNNAPHSTLSKYAGQLVSPEQVDNDEELEFFIVRNIKRENFQIMNSPTFDIKINQPIRVFNEKTNFPKRRTEIEPGNWRINRRLGPLFEIIDDKGKKNIKSRYQIDYL